MQRIFILIIVLLVLSLIALPILFIHFQTTRTQISATNTFYKAHILGGFSIDTPERATKAASDGVQVVFKYCNPPSESASLGQKLQSLHMKIVDGYISSYLYYYPTFRSLIDSFSENW